jgi:hypothetical protein
VYFIIFNLIFIKPNLAENITFSTYIIIQYISVGSKNEEGKKEGKKREEKVH